MKRAPIFLSLFSFAILTVLACTTHATISRADTAPIDNTAVQAQIDAHSQQISAIQKDIDAYSKQLTALGSQKQTLQSSISSIDTSKKKTQAQISQTQTKLQTAQLQLSQLSSQILTKQQTIDLDKQTLAESIRQIHSDDQTPEFTMIFASDTFANVLSDIGNETQLTVALKADAQSLSSDAAVLASQQNQVSATKDQLAANNKNLQTQQGQLTATEQAKQDLLTKTKASESTYQTLLAQKKAQEKQFESELSSLQNSLKSVSASQIPHTGQGILAWPFSDATMTSCKGKAAALGNPYCITQYFGNTAFATANAAIYSGMGHDGVDIGVPVGTPVEAALSGTISGTGNTDLSHNSSGAQCYSFGKWVMIQHDNGLNTMYAHLSTISATKGQRVSTGDVIGYSGMTGYATGPHLHFGVYATAGVQYLTLGQFHGTNTPCSGATMPVAPPSAYLNPLSYL
jgi:murein DD-endopeptidase MepM/ murein hydrolase activator NlpD